MNFNSPDLVPGEGNVRGNWRQTNEARDAARILDRDRRRLMESIEERRRQFTLAGYDFHPFKVYLAQMAFADEDNPTADQSTWWRCFLIRCGEVGDLALGGFGCDQYDIDPLSDFIPSETDNDTGGEPLQPIVAPDNTPFFAFWIELTKAGPALHCGVDPSVATHDYQNVPIKNPWATWPTPDGLHFLIAEVDTQTNTATKGPASIRQYLVADINNGLPISSCDGTGAALTLAIPLAYQLNPPN